MSGETAGSEWTRTRKIGFWGGLGAFFLLFVFFDPVSDSPAVGRMAAIAVLMAIWWITDAIPLAATALVPLVLYPLAGILSGKETAPIYLNYVLFLFIGGFLIALAMERWNLHKRIALAIIGVVGTRPSRLVLGFMLATAFLSMWISNTATAIMMLAIGLAVIQQAEDTFGRDHTGNLSVSILLGIAYSASIGGLATLVGTPPNLALVRIFELSFPGAEAAGYELSFGRWMLLGVPLCLIMLFIVWVVLTQICFRAEGDLTLSRKAIREQQEQLGPIGFEERAVLVVFVLTALLWVFRKDLALGSLTIPGWSNLVPFRDRIDDGTIAIAMALVLFLIPSRDPEKPGALLDPDVFVRLPWSIILLFGGGFALAKGFQVSGLSGWIGGQFVGLEGASPTVLVLTITTSITFLTELTSNTATTEMILPLLAAVATAAQIHPLVLMVPAALAASCAFMMPVATPPNAIVFASNRIRIGQMVKAGIVINLIGIGVITAVFLWLGPGVFAIDEGTVPTWVK